METTNTTKGNENMNKNIEMNTTKALLRAIDLLDDTIKNQYNQRDYEAREALTALLNQLLNK